MVAMKFDFRDLFRANRLAFSFQRLWIQFVGLGVGWILYVAFVYLATLLSGEAVASAWDRYGLLPDPVAIGYSWWGWILVGIGLFLLIAAWLVSATAVSRAAYMHLKGNTFYTWKEAMRFALKKKVLSLIATPLTILIIAFFTGLGGVIVGLIARIPVVGPLGVALFTLFWFAAGFFLLFVLVAAAVSLLLTPAILAATDDDAFEGIFQSFSILAGETWRLLVYESVVLLLSLAGFLVFAWVAKQAWILTTGLLTLGMGSDYAQISNHATYILQQMVYPVLIWIRTILGDFSAVLFFSRSPLSPDLTGIMAVSGWIAGISLVLLTGFVASYLPAVFNVGNTLIFLILKMKKDEENLLERKDDEEEDFEDLEAELEESAEEIKADADGEEES